MNTTFVQIRIIPTADSGLRLRIDHWLWPENFRFESRGEKFSRDYLTVQIETITRWPAFHRTTPTTTVAGGTASRTIHIKFIRWSCNWLIIWRHMGLETGRLVSKFVVWFQLHSTDVGQGSFRAHQRGWIRIWACICLILIIRGHQWWRLLIDRSWHRSAKGHILVLLKWLALRGHQNLFHMGGRFTTGRIELPFDERCWKRKVLIQLLFHCL